MANSTYLKQVPHLKSKKVIHVKQPEKTSYMKPIYI
jgi:hypothetical protein